MSWPGNGDPYYTAEGNGRRNYYAINSVPRLEVDGQWDNNPIIYTAAMRDAAYNVPAYMTLDVDYLVSCNKIDVNVEIIALQNFSGDNRLHVAVIEHETFANMKSNGETEFINVMKKMLPNQNGTALGGIANGDTINHSFTYDFQGEFRLPSDAGSPINHTGEHSVEEFFDLGVVVWVQNQSTKIVHQAAYGESPTKIDVGLSQLLTPTDLSENAGPFTISAVFQNWEDTAVNSAIIKYQIDNGAIETINFSGLNLGWGDSVHAVFPTQWNPASSGSYTLKMWIDQFNGGTMVDEISCNDTITQVITVHPAMAPIAGWTVYLAGSVGIFTNTTIEDIFDATTYFWDFGDGTSSTDYEPIHFYSQDGNYNTCLIATNSTGSDTSCQIVQIGMVGLQSQLENQIEVFPNPTQGDAVVANASRNQVKVELISPIGDVIEVRTLEADRTMDLDIRALSPGIYQIRISSIEGSVVKRIVKN